MEAGHAGLTFGFDLVGPEPGRRRGLVLKLAPPGVRRSGNTDVYKQAPLLRALRAAGLPVPGVPYADAGESWFGVPFIMMERLAGLPFFIWKPDPAFDCSAAAVMPLYEQTIAAMAALHRFDWRRSLPDWEEPRALVDEVLRWTLSSPNRRAAIGSQAVVRCVRVCSRRGPTARRSGSCTATVSPAMRFSMAAG